METHTSDSPKFVVAGRFLTGEEEERWRKALRDPVFVIVRIAQILLLATFALQGAALALVFWQASLFVLPLVAGCACFLIACSVRGHRRRRLASEIKAQDRWTDSRMIRGGSMISFYEDHAAHTTMRGSNFVYYRDVTVFCETADGIAFGNHRYCIYLRSMDLTPNEMNALRRFLQSVLPARYSLKSPAMPLRYEPLPTVRFANYDTVLTRAVVTDPRKDDRQRELLDRVIPQLLIYSVTPALMTQVTPLPLVNCLVFAVVFGFVGFGAVWWLCRLTERKEDSVMRLAFTEDGIARHRAGVTDFLVSGRVWIYPIHDGITMLFADGEQVDVPWSAMEDPAALQSRIPRREGE